MASIPIPSIVAAVGRRNIDSVVSYMGTDCSLYKVATRVPKDGLNSTFTTTYATVVSTKVVIVWDPEIRLLKALGLFTEDSKPILAYFKFEDDPNQNDYFELPVEYTVGNNKTNKFEVVDRKFHGYGVQQRAVWVIAPKREG